METPHDSPTPYSTAASRHDAVFMQPIQLPGRRRYDLSFNAVFTPGQGNVLKALLNYFVDLCLLRAAPQALPVSDALFALTFTANVLAGALLAVGVASGFGLSLIESLVEVVLALAVLRMALSLRGLSARFNQTASAMLGSSALLSLLALLLLTLGAGSGGESVSPADLALVILVVWSIVVLGHILRHAFELTLGQGVVVAFLYTFASYLLISPFFMAA